MSAEASDQSYAAPAPVVDEVRFEVVDHVARVTIDRPAVLNAVDKRTHDRLREIWAQVEQDPDVRVVVLTGAGDRAFCVGADMSASAIEKTGQEDWADLDPDGFGGLSLRTTLDVPVVGGFQDHVGTFYADDVLGGQPIRIRFIWTALPSAHPRWEQAFSRDQGETWETNWTMDFTPMTFVPERVRLEDQSD